MPNRPHMNQLVSLLRWSIKRMCKDIPECLWLGWVHKFFPTPSFFSLEGRPHTIMWPTLCAGSHVLWHLVCGAHDFLPNMWYSLGNITEEVGCVIAHMWLHAIKLHMGVEMNAWGGALYFLSSSHSFLTVTEYDHTSIMPHSLCI